MSVESNPDWIISDDELLALKSLGYCNIGRGKVARIIRGHNIEVMRQHENCGVTRQWANRQPHPEPQVVEHLYRLHLSTPVHVGQSAGDFPDSETTLTYTVMGSPENNAIVTGLIKRICRLPFGVSMSKREFDQLRTAEQTAKELHVAINKRYIAEAIF